MEVDSGTNTRRHPIQGPIALSADLEMDEEEGSREAETMIEGLRFDLEILRKRIRREKAKNDGNIRELETERKAL